MADDPKQEDLSTEELARLNELLARDEVKEAMGLLARSAKTMASVKTPVPVFDFILRLWGIFSFARQTCKSMEIASDALAFDALSGADELLHADIEKIDPETTEENRQQRIDLALHRFSDSFAERLSQHPAWVCNYSFVFLCTVFETFIDQLLRSILRVSPDFLSDEEITYGQAAHPREQDLLGDMIERKVASFSGKGMMDKVKLLTTKYRLPEARVFDYSDVTPDKEYVGWDRKKLKELVVQRNDVVHRDAVRVTEIDELNAIARFFEFLVIRLSLMAAAIHGASVSYRQDGR